MSATSLTDTDWAIRHFVYTFFVATTRPPSIHETAARFQLEPSEVTAAYHRLHAAHMFFLDPGSDAIRIANPLSAVPTAYQVIVGDKTYWANCAWDSLGIPAMLARDATIVATLPNSEERLTYYIRDGVLEAQSAFVHFPLPFRRWYDDLIDT